MAHYGSEGALCRPNDLLSTLGGYEPSGGKVQENDEERRHAYACRLEHRCLVYKTPSAERLSALPLAFALGRCTRMAMRVQQTDNRREFLIYIERLQYILEYICTVEGFSTK